ncbi:MAG: tetratricopeptide (TPR) repeat protein [Planctomycetota bacterium]|jgi:tetratricopeptide (TPR) repeat protein
MQSRHLDFTSSRRPAARYSAAGSLGKRALGILSMGCVLFASGGCLGKDKTPELTDKEKVELYSETASFLYEDSSFVRAQDQAVKVLEVDPENLAMRRMIGWIRLRSGAPRDLDIAEDFFRRLVRDGDDHAATVQGLATVCERLGLGYEETARSYETGAREIEEGDDREALVEDTHTMALKYWHEAETLYQSTLTEGEGSTRSKNGLQRVYAYLGKYDESLEMVSQVLEEAGLELANWRRMLTNSNIGEKDEVLFRTNEKAAIQLLHNTHLFAADLLYQQNRYADALSNVESALLLDSTDAELYSLRAQLRSKTGDYAGAIEDIDIYLRRSDTPLDHPDVRRAFDIRANCEASLARTADSGQ